MILLWTLVAFRTVVEGWQGKIFYAPCLASVVDKVAEPAVVVTATVEMAAGDPGTGRTGEEGGNGRVQA